MLEPERQASVGDSVGDSIGDNILQAVPLVCPLCRERDESEQTNLLERKSHHSWICPVGHHFDQAKQGYLNLLPAHFKRSKDPGDSKAMVQSRRRFLEAGHYRPIAEQLGQLIKKIRPKTARLLDAGCGEGYYLRQLQEVIDNGWQLLGNDVSKWAVQAAAPWHKTGHYVVASNARLPYPAGSLDVVVCGFGFVSAAEFKRVLVPDGTLITIDPLPQHLLALRELLYAETQQKTRHHALLAGFEPLEHHDLKFNFELKQEELQDLIAMTPHAYRAPADGKVRAREIDTLTLQGAVRFNVWRVTKEPL